MFGNDDFDFDEDFLKDADDQAISYYSQRDPDDKTSEAKRRKLDGKNDFDFSFNDSLDTNWSSTRNDKTSLNLKETNNKARQNLVLSIINEKCLNEKESQASSHMLQKSSSHILAKNSACHQQSTRSQRENLVLGILQKSCVQDSLHRNSNTADHVSQELLLSQSTQVERRDENCMNNPQRKSSNISLVKRSFNIMPTSVCSDENHPPLQTSKKADKPKHNLIDNSGRQLFLESLKPSSAKIQSMPQVFQQVIKTEKSPSEKVALVRKFPGPAGLLPDTMDSSIPPVSYLKSLDENDNTRHANPNEAKLTEYCSQNTKNLYTEGAWQQMLDDLPDGFLNGYEISTVKRIASEQCQQSTKVTFLAGILERIDHSHDNPFIILKDFTDSIQGVIHRDIPLEYPGLLEPNVVILLRDTGLLRISGSLLSNNYRILISPSHLLGIYTGKGKIVRTSRMKSILGQHLKHRLEEDTETTNNFPVQSNRENQNKSQISSCNTSVNSKNVRNSETELNLSQADENQIVKTLSLYLEDRNDETFQNSNLPSISDDDADFSFSVSPRKITDLKNKKNFTLHETLSTVSETRNPILSREQSSHNSKNSCRPEKQSLRSKLLQFKSNDVLTPPESSDTASRYQTHEGGPCREKENEKLNRHSSDDVDFASNVLNDSDDDTDDAVLSQLDMDSIMNNYN